MNITIEKYDTFDLCPECNGKIILIKEEVEIVCKHCGLVISEKEISFTSY